MILVTADFQTAGRGQAGNSWESEAGKNLLFGLLFHPREVEANRQFILSQAVALSICETLSDYAEDIRIKWPNDIYWKDRKICGMLIENTLVGRCIENCIIGAGININQQTFCSDAPNPVSLRQITGKEQEPVFILADTIKRFKDYYRKIQQGQTEDIVRNYRERLYRHNGFHLYQDADGVFEAEQRRAIGIEIKADVLVLVKSTGHILEQGAANQRGGVDVRVLRSPSEGGAGQTEAIGGGHDDLVALELHANAGQYRAVFFAGDGNARLVHGLNESRGIDLAEHGRYHRQIRVLGVGHELQGELRLAGRDGQRGAVGDQVRFLRTQRFGDIGQQLALNQYGTGFVNAGFDVVASGNLVVEGGELQRSVNGFQLDTSENRVGGTCVDDSGGPGYGVGQGCSIDFDFHV